MCEDFLESLAYRLIQDHPGEVRAFEIDTDQDREQLLRCAYIWVEGCNPLRGGDLIEQRPLPAQLQPELNAFAIGQRYRQRPRYDVHQ
ncbi:TPA: hypothetical protein VDV84_002263 [Pseudomonas aeruginosa]|nr:hypothetical protein [Pseudomonas aeruginosa]HBO2581207.1 hypothetical protein [Pseudomonas aeruginosa]HBO2600016.1 hypothetical protein [Pseudomonas aeruginosa]HCK0545428.1 hypothetical protein [Pseudomonas aeruginosa]HEP7920585.1 hypothetical protein [Pseudomonas aeruginosa]